MARKSKNVESEPVEGFWVYDKYHKLSRWPDLCKLSFWQPQPVDWLWEPYVPAAAVSLLSGATGVGKTYLALAMAAAVTGQQSASPGSVLYMTVGNDPEQFLRPRFDKLGGDPDRLHVVRGFDTDVTPAEFSLLQPCEIADTLPTLIKNENLRLIIIDPFATYLGSGRGECATRTLELVELLARMAENTRCGVLLVGSAKPPAALAAAVRSELVAGILTAPAAGAQKAVTERALVQVKSNLGPVGRPLGYTIASGDHFSWCGDSGVNDAGLLLPEDNLEKRVALRAAIEFLRQVLATGPVPASKVRQAAKEEGISEHTLRRAKDHLGVFSDKDGLKKWDWRLNSSPATEAAGGGNPAIGPKPGEQKEAQGRLQPLQPLLDSAGLAATA